MMAGKSTFQIIITSLTVVFAVTAFSIFNISPLLPEKAWANNSNHSHAKLLQTGLEPTLYVSEPIGNDSYDGSQEHPKKTIQAGIDLADQLYDTANVFVAEGIYVLSGGPIVLREGISLSGGHAADWSERNPKFHLTTIIDQRTTGGSDGFPNAAIRSDETITSQTVIDGFTIRASGGAYSVAILIAGSPTISNNIILGGQVSVASFGIYIQSDAAPAIHMNHIDGGKSDDRATGIYSSRSSRATITENTIIGGETRNGTAHAIYGISAASWIANNTIIGGHCVSDQCYSCGIREADGSNSIIINNTIDGGTGYRAYGILTSDGSNPKIYNNTIDAGDPVQTAIGIYIKNDDNPRIINNLIFTSGGQARFCIYENDPGDFPGHPNPDSNPSILRNNNLFDCPTALLSWFDESNISWHSVTDLNTPITTAEDGIGTMTQWGNISEDISDYLDSEYRFIGDLNDFLFDVAGRNGAHLSFALGFDIDKDGKQRSPIDNSETTGWSMGAYEYDAGSPPPLREDINQDGAVDSLDLQVCLNVFIGKEQDPVFIQRADVNKDGEIGASDYSQILHQILSVSLKG